MKIQIIIIIIIIRISFVIYLSQKKFLHYLTKLSCDSYNITTAERLFLSEQFRIFD